MDHLLVRWVDVFRDQLCGIDGKMVCDFDYRIQPGILTVLPVCDVALAHSKRNAHGGRTRLFLFTNLFQSLVEQNQASFFVYFVY